MRTVAKHAVVKSFWKYIPESAFTHEQAAAKAKDLEHHAPVCTGPERYFRYLGWEFDIGRRPFLIEWAGGIHRVWGRSVDDVRKGFSVPRKAKIADDPFSK